jgi:hypothetical protein
MTFGYLWRLYVHMCGINDPGHTCDEYLVLLAKSGMTNSFANRVVERNLWKHDKFYQRGRACIEKVRGSVEFFFPFSFVGCPFLVNSWFLWFSYSRWLFLSSSLVFGHLVVLHLILNPKFKLCAFGVVDVPIRGRLRNQVVCALVYMYDE